MKTMARLLVVVAMVYLTGTVAEASYVTLVNTTPWELIGGGSVTGLSDSKVISSTFMGNYIGPGVAQPKAIVVQSGDEGMARIVVTFIHRNGANFFCQSFGNAEISSIGQNVIVFLENRSDDGPPNSCRIEFR